MKKLLALSLALVMLCLTVSACFAEAEDPYGRYDEPVHITILSTDFKTGTTAYDSSDPTRKSAEENAWIQAYKDYLNIEVERIIAEDDTALQAQIATGLADGSLPDVVICGKKLFYSIVENEMAQDLLPAYNEYTATYGKYLKEAADDMLFTGMVDGQLLGFPISNNWYNSTQLLWVRQDWLKKVGKEMPKTLDEMLDVARAFKEAKLGGEDTVGLGMFNSNANYDYRGILAAYGAVYSTWMEQEDGTYVFGNVSDGMKDGLLKMQEIYKEGLIQSDFASIDTKTLAAEVANGQIGMYYATAWHSVTDMKTSMINDPEADWMCVPVPTLDGQRVPQRTNASVGTFCVVNPDYEHPEAILKMMELEQKVYQNPSKEELPKLYTADDGFLYWDLRIFRNFGRADFDLYRSELINAHLANNDPLDAVEPVVYDFYDQILKALDGERSLYGRYLCQAYAYPIDAELLAQGLLRPEYNGPTTETMSIYETTLNTELNNAMVKVIMGEDISVFEKAVEDWYKNGGQTITDEVNAYYASNK